MTDISRSIIPPEKSAAVSRGLQEAFGTTTIDEIRAIPSGLNSDLFFRIVIQGSPLLLTIMPRIDEMNDPKRIFAAMQAEADGGVSPRVWHVNVEDGITITDWVEAVALPISEALVRIPGMLRKLHALPPFPKAFNYVTAHNGFIWRFRTANLLPVNEVEEIYARYNELCAVYPRLDSDIVSSHGDLKPENILFDGERVWLAGWKVAFLNDRYFDLAVAANFVVGNDADEKDYLETYFGQPPDEYQRARFFLMRQVAHMLSATLLLLIGSAGKPVDANDPVPSFTEFHRRLWAGEVNLADNKMKIAYGRVHWEQLSRNMRGARFEEALRIVSGRHAASEGIPRLLPAAP